MYMCLNEKAGLPQNDNFKCLSISPDKTVYGDVFVVKIKIELEDDVSKHAE